MLFKILLIIICSNLYTFVQGQKYLQVENPRAKIAARYQAGDEVTFLLHNDKQPHTGSIMRINPDERSVQLGGWLVFIDSIAAIRSNNIRAVSTVGTYLRNVGGVALINTLIAELFFKPRNVKEFAIITGSMAASGQVMRMAGRKKKWYRKVAGYRLRIIDLQFYSN